MTALERVVQAESMKISDGIFESLKSTIDSLSQDQFPLSIHDFHRMLRKPQKQAVLELQKQMAPILSFQEICQETGKFEERVEKQVIACKWQENYNASYHYAIGVLNKLFAAVSEPFSQSDKHFQVHDYLSRWVSLVKEYRDLAKDSCIQFEVFVEAIVANADLVDQSLIEYEGVVQGKDLEEKEGYDDGGNKKQMERKVNALEIMEKVLQQFEDVLNEQLARLNQTLSDSQANERRLASQKQHSDHLIELQRQ